MSSLFNLSVTPAKSKIMNSVINFGMFNNHTMDFSLLKNSGVEAVIHLSSQGNSVSDDLFINRGIELLKQGYLYGAFHIVTGDSVASQVNFFISRIMEMAKHMPKAVILPVFSVIENPSNSAYTITKEQAVELATLFRNKTGVYPVIFANSTTKDILKGEYLEELSNCPLWYASYVDLPENIKDDAHISELGKTWDRWDLWQYTDGFNGGYPRHADGFGNVSRSKLRINGDSDSVRDFWYRNSLRLS